jgi:general secretion pathway protein G
MTKRMRGGFGFADLVIGLLLLALLGALALGAADKAKETDNRVQCARNLRMIGMAALMYSNENKGNFPRTRFKVDAEKPTAYTGWQSADPFDPAKGQPPDFNDVTAAMFLLLRTQDINSDVFVCPSSAVKQWDYAPLLEKDKTNKPTAQNRSNFPSPAFLSYSYANPYPNKAAIALGYKLNSTLPAEFALAADMNPGGKALAALTADAPADKMKDGNSPNHARAGQNVLYGDGHVEFVTTPFAGTAAGNVRDNIYTVGGSDDGKVPTSPTITASPRWAGDSVLLPTAQDKGDEKAEKLSPPPAPAPAPVAQARVRDAKYNMAKTQVFALSTALEQFEIDAGQYPTTAQGLLALSAAPAGAKNWRGPYIRGQLPKDPWQNPYQYRNPGKQNKTGFDVWSYGPDGKDRTLDDIGNWDD